MHITFEPLAKSHLSLLLRWLEAPHVKAWWDQGVHWTPKLIQEKYGSYIEGYKIQDGIQKEIHAYIIYIDTKPIGYIQFYNAYDFPRSAPLIDLPPSLGAFDIFIGEENYIGKNVGSRAIVMFLDEYCTNKYTHIFADPDINNIVALNAYTKAGFKKIKESTETKEIWMLKEI
jgi:RimJ/RimL family protein N-acetyltransferase